MRCVWPALNPLSIHVTFTAIVPGATQGGQNVQKLTHVPLAIAIFLVLYSIYLSINISGSLAIIFSCYVTCHNVVTFCYSVCMRTESSQVIRNFALHCILSLDHEVLTLALKVVTLCGLVLVWPWQTIKYDHPNCMHVFYNTQSR